METGNEADNKPANEPTNISAPQTQGKAKKKSYPRTRNINLAIRVTEAERGMIEKRMAQTNINNMRAFIVKMAIDGRVIHVELSSVREMVRLLSNATNNINQIAKRANEIGSIYARDISVLQGHYDELWTQAKEILQKLAVL